MVTGNIVHYICLFFGKRFFLFENIERILMTT